MGLYLKYFNIHLKSAMQHKMSFFVTLIGQGMTTLFSFLSMYFLFDRFGHLKGYTFNEVLLCFSTIFMTYASICFFTLEGLEFMNIFLDGGRELGQYPLDIYKDWVLKFFAFVIPLTLINYYPFLYLIGKNTLPDRLSMCMPLGTFIFVIPCYALWCLGVRYYQSTGS